MSDETLELEAFSSHLISSLSVTYILIYYAYNLRWTRLFYVEKFIYTAMDNKNVSIFEK